MFLKAAGGISRKTSTSSSEISDMAATLPTTLKIWDSGIIVTIGGNSKITQIMKSEMWKGHNDHWGLSETIHF